MPPWWFGGNSPIDQDEALWHPSKEAVALRVATSRRATNVWIWEHKYGLHKLQRSELIKLLQPKGKIDEPNPLTAEIKEWNGDDVFVSVGWGFEPVIGKAVVAWNLSQHKWRASKGVGPGAHRAVILFCSSGGFGGNVIQTFRLKARPGS